MHPNWAINCRIYYYYSTIQPMSLHCRREASLSLFHFDLSCALCIHVTVPNSVMSSIQRLLGLPLCLGWVLWVHSVMQCVHCRIITQKLYLDFAKSLYLAPTCPRKTNISCSKMLSAKMKYTRKCSLVVYLGVGLISTRCDLPLLYS